MGIFGGRQQISRRDFRQSLRKAPARIPGAGGKMYSLKQRIAMEKEIFGAKYGSHVSRQEYQKRLRILGKEKYRTKATGEKIRIDRQIRYLKELRGK